MDIRGEPFLEVVRSLASEAGVPFVQSQEDQGGKARKEERDLILEVLALASRYYRYQLVEGRAGERARAYLEKRSISDEAAERFELGYAPAGWENLARFLQKKGVDPALGAKAGLLSERSSGGGHYDRFRDRLIFPIANATGKIVSFGGRILDGGEPKYLNGPETFVFHKGEHLYGLFEGMEALRREHRAVLVEGYFDVISLHSRGFETAVATLGTALNAQHILTLRRRVDQVILLYDGDDPGRKAAFRGLDLFLTAGYPCTAAFLPSEHDPDSFVRSGGDLGGILKAAKPLFELFLEDVRARTDLRTVEGLLSAVEEVVPKLSVITDPLAQTLYVSDAAQALGVDQVQLQDRVRGSRSSDRRTTSEPKLKQAGAAADPLDRAVLESLIHQPEHRRAFVSRGVEAWMRPGPVREASRFVAGRTEQAGALPVDEADDSVRKVLTEVLVSDEHPPNAYLVLETRLRVRELEAKGARIVAQIREAETSGQESRVVELLREKAELDRSLVSCRQAASAQLA